MSRQRLLNGLYLLAAAVLLLQSFAIWHDVEHPFHTADSQCERLDGIHHTPAVDHSPSLAVVPVSFSSGRNIKAIISDVSDRTPATTPIRGPPHRV